MCGSPQVTLKHPAHTAAATQVEATKGRHRLERHRAYVLRTIKAMVTKCIDAAVGGKAGAASGQQLFDTFWAWQAPRTYRH